MSELTPQEKLVDRLMDIGCEAELLRVAIGNNDPGGELIIRIEDMIKSINEFETRLRKETL